MFPYCMRIESLAQATEGVVVPMSSDQKEAFRVAQKDRYDLQLKMKVAQGCFDSDQLES